jgi:hypothetical protein
MTTNGNDNRTEMKLDQVTKMLSALLKSTNNYHVVGAYAWGYTSNDDPFLVLYPQDDRLKHKVCRVYPHDFGKLPADIVNGKPDAGPDDPGDRDRAEKRGILRPCPMMGVVTYDGKETQMGPEKRFSDVIWVSRKGQATKPQGTPPAQPRAKAQTQTQPTAANGKPKAEVTPAGADVAVGEECIKLAKSVYMEDWTPRLAELCRAHTEGKISGIGELNTAQATRVRDSLLLRREFHLLGAKKFGDKWPATCQHNVRRIGGEFVDYDSELKDEQVERLVEGMKALASTKA